MALADKHERREPAIPLQQRIAIFLELPYPAPDERGFPKSERVDLLMRMIEMANIEKVRLAQAMYDFGSLQSRSEPEVYKESFALAAALGLHQEIQPAVANLILIYRDGITPSKEELEIMGKIPEWLGSFGPTFDGDRTRITSIRDRIVSAGSHAYEESGIASDVATTLAPQTRPILRDKLKYLDDLRYYNGAIGVMNDAIKIYNDTEAAVATMKAAFEKDISPHLGLGREL